jgi:hypothetical protein
MPFSAAGPGAVAGDVDFLLELPHAPSIVDARSSVSKTTV